MVHMAEKEISNCELLFSLAGLCMSNFQKRQKASRHSSGGGSLHILGQDTTSGRWMTSMSGSTDTWTTWRTALM